MDTSYSTALCALTKKSLSHPMISKKSGHLFEKEAIEQHLASIPYCPLTNQPLSLDDLIQLASNNITQILSNVEPTGTVNRPDCSLLGYMKTLQQQYDSLAIQIFQIKKALQVVRQEHTVTLFRSKAASQVIAKLLAEKKSLEAQIQKLSTIS